MGKHLNVSGHKIQRSRRNEIFAWGIRWLQLARRNNLLFTVLAVVVLIGYLIVPTGALVTLHLDVQRERQSRPARTNVSSIKGLSYQDAETKLRASNLNIRLLATRCDLPLQPGLIIDQSPQPGEEVVYGYPVGVTITKADSHGHGP
jgi:beta-lactam-binding protein with PASTA domain